MQRDPLARETAAAVLVARLETHGRKISDSEREELERTIHQVVEVKLGQDIVREGELKNESSLIVSGWACRYSDLPDGRRQILALHVPGDFVDLHSYQLKVMDHSVRALTPCRVATVPHDNITRITEHFPHLTRQLWLVTLVDAAVMRQWMLGLGQRSALENMAHLLCEMYHRLRAVGLVNGKAFTLPINQIELSETLGLSPVHTNRVVQELRAQNLLVFRGHAAELPDVDALEAIADFDPTYLHLGGPAGMLGRE